jgi:hypothetical protein
VVQSCRGQVLIAGASAQSGGRGLRQCRPVTAIRADVFSGQSTLSPCAQGPHDEAADRQARGPGHRGACLLVAGFGPLDETGVNPCRRLEPAVRQVEVSRLVGEALGILLVEEGVAPLVAALVRDLGVPTVLAARDVRPREDAVRGQEVERRLNAGVVAGLGPAGLLGQTGGPLLVDGLLGQGVRDLVRDVEVVVVLEERLREVGTRGETGSDAFAGALAQLLPGSLKHPVDRLGTVGPGQPRCQFLLLPPRPPPAEPPHDLASRSDLRRWG